MKRRRVSGPILTLDVGGSHVKLRASNRRTTRRVLSGPDMTARVMVRAVRKLAADWEYRAVAIGYPGMVVDGAIVTEPHNLGAGWIGYDFAKAFGCPVRIINDAAMQALGTYHGGRMLFLGVGTGLGAAFIADGRITPMELAHMTYRRGKSYEYYLGELGLERMGRAKWEKHVRAVAKTMRKALRPDDAVLGGGNVRRLKRLPSGYRAGSNADALAGGFRLWREAPARTL